MSALLTIKDLWGGYKEGVDILRGIDLSVEEGQAVGIIGLNGSGKSTLGKAILNMIPIRRGDITFAGEPVMSLSTHELAQKGLSIMQQGGRVFPNLSVWENLELAFNTGMGEGFNQLRAIIPMLQRPKKELQRQMADKLSGGQKHQLALAMTLATRPRLVILDEPSAGLSPRAVEEMYGILQTMRDNLKVTVVLIEQAIARAVGFCQTSLLMGQGQLKEVIIQSDIKSIESLMFNNIEL